MRFDDLKGVFQPKRFYGSNIWLMMGTRNYYLSTYGFCLKDAGNSGKSLIYHFSVSNSNLTLADYAM